MRLYLDIDDVTSEKITSVIIEESQKHLNKILFDDEGDNLRQIIREIVGSQTRAAVNDILQGQDIREFLRNKILTEIGMK